MVDLFWFEFKKIACKRFNIIIVLCTAIIIALLFWLPAKNEMGNDKDGNSVLGKQAIAAEKECCNKYAGELTNQRIKKDIREYQNLFLDPDNLSKDEEGKNLNLQAINKYVWPYSTYWRLIDYVYIEPYYDDYEIMALRNVSIKQEFDFYKMKNQKIQKLLNLTYQDYNYSEKEKEFWTNKTKKISEPFQFGYYGGWDIFFKMGDLFAIPIVAICICISTVFVGEYQSQTDSLILSAKYGKSKLVVAKLMAAFSFAIIIFGLYVLLATAILFFNFGVDGASFPLQLIDAIIPYDFTMFQGYLICVLTTFLVMLGLTSLTLLMSAKMKKSAIPVITVIIFVVFSGSFLSYNQTSSIGGIWNHILILFPYMAVSPVWISEFQSYFSWDIFGKVFDVVSMRMIVYIILTISCVPLAGYFFKKHQVK